MIGLPTWDAPTPTWGGSSQAEPTLKRTGDRDFDVNDYSPAELAALRKVLAVYFNGSREFVMACSVEHGWVDVPKKVNGVPVLDGFSDDVARVRKYGNVEIVMLNTGQVFRAD